MTYESEHRHHHDRPVLSRAQINAALVAGMHSPPSSRITTLLGCQIHTKHVPASHLNVLHHIWPLADGGRDDADNVVVVCPTGHDNIHQLIDAYRVHGGAPPYNERRRWAFGEREYARLAWAAITAARRI